MSRTATQRTCACRPTGRKTRSSYQHLGPPREHQALRGRGLGHVLECGPGRVLSGLVRRVDAELVSAAVLDPASLREAQGMLQ